MEYCSNTSTVIVNVERLEGGRTLAALCVAKNREGLTRWAPAAFEAGRWQAPSREGENPPKREQVAAYFTKTDGQQGHESKKQNDADEARKVFEAAWWNSGAPLQAEAPFVSTEVWEAASKQKSTKPTLIAQLDASSIAGPPSHHSWHVRAVEGGWTAVGGWGAELLSKRSAGSAKPDEKRSKPTGRTATKPKRG